MTLNMENLSVLHFFLSAIVVRWRAVRKLGSLLFLLQADIYSISARSYTNSTAELSENSLSPARLIQGFVMETEPGLFFIAIRGSIF